MMLASEQHVDDLPSTSQDTIGKKKSRVKFPCMLCRGSHQNFLCLHMEEASKLLEDVTISQPQLPVSYHKLTLDPPVVDGMINLVPSLVSLVDMYSNWSHPQLNQLTKWSIQFHPRSIPLSH
jgi:hypothetical protein